LKNKEKGECLPEAVLLRDSLRRKITTIKDHVRLDPKELEHFDLSHEVRYISSQSKEEKAKKKIRMVVKRKSSMSANQGTRE
jgi:hypothetical protein